jgi:hypothetical protein
MLLPQVAALAAAGGGGVGYELATLMFVALMRAAGFAARLVRWRAGDVCLLAWLLLFAGVYEDTTHSPLLAFVHVLRQVAASLDAPLLLS